MKDLSIVIVSYNVKEFVYGLLSSLRHAHGDLDIETFVVDNDSRDESADMVRENFPEVTLIEPGENLGFARANNLALRKASGRYLMLLNPDCILREDSLIELVKFLDENPKAGAVGPKLLNRDGTFQVSSKRGLPTPWASFCKLSGVSSIFPRSRIFNSYELGYLDPDHVHEIDVLCGAAMVVRREAYEKVGGLNEEYFMFGEDIDWSYSIQRAGWKIYYVPTSNILHYKGESSKRAKTGREVYFYDAMRIFVRRHFSGKVGSLLVLEIGILLGQLIARLQRLAPKWLPALIDTILLYILYTFSGFIQFEKGSKHSIRKNAFLHTLSVMLGTTLSGLYRRGNGHGLTRGLTTGIALSGTLTYLLGSLPFNPSLFAWNGVAGFSGLKGWRYMLKRKYSKSRRRRLLIVGIDKLGKAVVQRLREEKDESLEITGWLECGEPDNNIEHMDIPVLGHIDDFVEIALRNGINEVIFSTDSVSYSQGLNLVTGKLPRRVHAQFIPDRYDQDKDRRLLNLESDGKILRRIAFQETVSTSRV